MELVNNSSSQLPKRGTDRDDPIANTRVIESRVVRPSAPPVPSNAITPMFVWRVWARWWKVATPLSLLLLAIASVGLWWQFEPKYRAVALLQIQDAPTHLAYPQQDDSRRYVQNQIELIRSALVIGPALSNADVAAIPEIMEQPEPVSWLAKRIRVAAIGSSELFEVSYDSPDAQGATRLVNAVVESYLQLRNEQDTSRNQRMLELLDEEKQIRSQEVARLRENVRELSNQISGRDAFTGAPAGDVVVINHPIDGLMTRLSAIEVERRMLEVQMAAMGDVEANPRRELPAKMIDSAVERRPEITEIKALISSKEGLRDRVLETSIHGEKDPAHRRLGGEIEQLNQRLARLKISLRDSVKDELQIASQVRHGEEFAGMEQSLLGVQAAEKVLREQYDKQLKQAGQTGSQSLDLEFARAELVREERVFELIAQRALALRTETRAPARVARLKMASVPMLPFETFPLSKWLMAAAGCFALPLGVAFLWERTIRRINDAEQLDHEASVQVVGEVARLPQRTDRVLANITTIQDLSLFEESVDSLRTCLVLGDERSDVRVIAVASAVSGEGKTSVAAQLAVSIARATGEKTLLIDADLRSPDVHRLFQIVGTPGLADVLESRLTLAEAINTQWSEFVHVLPAGEMTGNPHQLVNGSCLRSLISDVRAQYAYVIVDTPPILLASEALVIAKEVDGVLLCTMRDHSREAQVKAACERLRTVGARNLGAVLNGVPSRQYAAKYSSYRYQRAGT